jgi:hypothetical protein
LAGCLEQALDDCDVIIEHVNQRKKKIQEEIMKVKEVYIVHCIHSRNSRILIIIIDFDLDEAVTLSSHKTTSCELKVIGY